MVVSRRRTASTPSQPLLLDNHPLDQVKMFKYLGVLLSHDLSWGEHVQSVRSRARKILGLLYRRFYNNAPSHSLLQLYLSLVRPHLDYASAIWSPHTKKDIIMLDNVQKFACRMATKFWDSGYEDLLEIVHLPSLECRRLETRLCLLYKIVHKLCYFDDFYSQYLSYSPCTSQPCIDPTLCSYEFIIFIHLYYTLFLSGTTY